MKSLLIAVLAATGLGGAAAASRTPCAKPVTLLTVNVVVTGSGG